VVTLQDIEKDDLVCYYPGKYLIEKPDTQKDDYIFEIGKCTHKYW